MDLNEFLSPYTPAVQQLVINTCELVRSAIPEAIEQIDPADHLIAYGYDLTYKGLICAVIPYKSYINLIFSKGTMLPDPDRLLEGTGKFARHVKIRNTEDIDKPALRLVIQQAAAITREEWVRKK